MVPYSGQLSFGRTGLRSTRRLPIRYSDLVDTPEAALRSLFDFLNEPFAAECLTPLRNRINSSNVPADFQIGDSATDLTVVERATELWAELDKTPQPSEASPAAAEEIEAAFAERVQYVANMEQLIAALYARAERLAKEVKGKKAIIQHLRGRRQRYKSRRSFFRRDSGKLRNGWWNALRDSFRRRTRKS